MAYLNKPNELLGQIKLSFLYSDPVLTINSYRFSLDLADNEKETVKIILLQY